MWRADCKIMSGNLLLNMKYSEESVRMDRSPKKHTKFLILTLTLIISLSLGVNFLMSLTDLGNTGSMRTGLFVNTNQEIDSSGWYFSADEADGHSTFFAILTQSNLDNFLVESRILEGEMILIITQGSVRLVFDLSEARTEMTTNEIDIRALEPGRVDMRLYFTDAQNIEVITSWRE